MSSQTSETDFLWKCLTSFLCSNKYDYDHFYDTSELYRRRVGAMNLSSDEIRCCHLPHFLPVILPSLSSLHVFALKYILWQETGSGDEVVKQNLPCLSLSHSAMYLNSETFQQQQKYHSKRISHSFKRNCVWDTKEHKASWVYSSLIRTFVHTSIASVLIWCSGALLPKTVFSNKILKGLSFIKWRRAVTKG